MTTADLLLEAGRTSLAVGALIALVLIIRKPFARVFGARAAYALWLAPALRLVLPELRVLPAPATSETLSGPIVWAAMNSPGAGAPVAPAAFDWLGVAAGAALFLWIAVAVAIAATRLADHARAMRAARIAGASAPASLKGECDAAARALGLKRRPELRVADDATGPAVMGVLRPLVILPARFETDYSAEERRLALAHELAHIARGDLAAGLVAVLLQAAQWPNPLAHMALRAFRADQEAACDAFVLARAGGGGGAGDYASAILKSARGATPPAPAMSLGHPLKERLMLMKKSPNSPARRLAGGVCAAALVAASLAASANYGYAADPDQNREKIITEDIRADADGDIVRERRIMLPADRNGEGATVQVMEFDEKDGGRRVVRIENGEKTVRVYDKNGKLLTENVSRLTDGDGTFWWTSGGDESVERVMVKRGERMVVMDSEARGGLVLRLEQEDGSDEIVVLKSDSDDRQDFRIFADSLETREGVIVAHCNGDGSGEPTKLEWREEKGDDGDKHVEHMILCIAGDVSSEKRADALRNAIEKMEESAKKQSAARERAIEELRKQLDEIEGE